MSDDEPVQGANWFSKCASGGCGSKIGLGDLAAILSKLPKTHDPKLLVGYDGADDAAVYQLNPEEGLIFTSD
ncbi:MAG: hypothetical protein LBJ61_00410, partial [Deltaproteobacteria bacterium]|nr:hypothetical protein [Deltaproteobacteria bacterium]